MPKLIMRHYSDPRPNHWPWTSFAPKELASKGNGSIAIEYEALDKLQSLRNAWGKLIHLTSAYRDPVHNARVGGAKLSQHKAGRAFDVRVAGWIAQEKAEFKELALAHGFTGFGGYNTFIHIDIGHPRKWGQSWAWPKSYGGN